MKKFIAGILCGMVLMVSVSAYADSMIGKKVDAIYPLKINGQRAAKDVIAIEGTSYLPVRAAGEMFGYQVDFINQEVVLMNKSVENFTNTYVKPPQPKDIYLVTSTIIKTMPGDYKYIIRNGEGYLPDGVFGYYKAPLDNFTKTSIMVPNGREIIYSNENPEGDNIFVEDGTIYIKLSALGLKAVIKNNGKSDVLWLENI